MERPALLVLIPAYNEEGRIGGVVRSIHEHVAEAKILVIDDGSSDNTGVEARRAGAEVLRHPFNLGYGSALHTGYLYARSVRAARVAQMDADGQHDPASLETLLRALDQGADVAVGSRYREGAPPPTSLARRIGSRLFAWIVTVWTGVEITDPTSGFQALSARALEVVAEDGYPEDYPDADVLITLAREGLKLVEVPVRMHARLGGMSMHRGGRAAYYGYKMLLTLTLLGVRRRSPYRRSAHSPAVRTETRS